MISAALNAILNFWLTCGGGKAGDEAIRDTLFRDRPHGLDAHELANALQQAGKTFELMLYPNSRHGVRDKAQIHHLYRLKTRFLREKL